MFPDILPDRGAPCTMMAMPRRFRAALPSGERSMPMWRAIALDTGSYSRSPTAVSALMLSLVRPLRRRHMYSHFCACNNVLYYNTNLIKNANAFKLLLPSVEPYLYHRVFHPQMVQLSPPCHLLQDLPQILKNRQDLLDSLEIMPKGKICDHALRCPICVSLA